MVGCYCAKDMIVCAYSDETCIDFLDEKLLDSSYKDSRVINFNIYSTHPEQIIMEYDLGYFYTPRMKYTETTTTNKPNREAGLGRWYPYSGQIEIKDDDNQVIIGYKQTFRYCEQTVGDNSSNGKENQSKWFMHEYSKHSVSSDYFDRFTINKLYLNKRWKVIMGEETIPLSVSKSKEQTGASRKRGRSRKKEVEGGEIHVEAEGGGVIASVVQIKGGAAEEHLGKQLVEERCDSLFMLQGADENADKGETYHASNKRKKAH